MASSDFGCMLSVGAIRFEDRFCTSKKGGIREVGGFTPECHAHGSCFGWLEKSLGQQWLNHFSPCKHKQAQDPLFSPCRGTISESVGCFQSVGVLTGRRALTIEKLLMSGCG